MFDLTSSKLLILGVVALIVVGPKELPFLLRTIGKYVGMIRRQATEFRSQFDEAMREAELDGIKKDLENVARDTENTIRSAQTSFEADMHATSRDLEQSVHKPAGPEPVHTYDALNGLDTNSGPVVIEPPMPLADSANQVGVPHDVAAHKPAADYAKTGA
jgi:sec-independent protein translocase protein TatB